MNTSCRLAALAVLPALISACSDDTSSPPVDAARDGITLDAATADGGTLGSPADAGLTSDGAFAAADSGQIPANRPDQRAFSPALLGQLKVPSGFHVAVYASNLVNPRWLALAPDGAVYVTVPSEGQVVRLHDDNGDGDADDPGERLVAAGKADDPALEGVHGLAISSGKVYLASVKSVLSATPGPDGRLTGLTKLLIDLPDGGQHPNRTLGVGPDGKLYVSIGSLCNNCGSDPTPETAAMLRVETSGAPSTNPANSAHPLLAHNPSAMIPARVWASGLRNTLGFDWNPSTQELWGWDQGSDGLGNDLPPEELNHLQGGKSYGWPYCWGQRAGDPTVDEPSKTVSKAQYCPTTEPPVTGYQAHSSPIGFLFYQGHQFPTDYSGDAFISFRGSWDRAVPTGYKVVRVHFANGVPAPLPGSTDATQDFLSGFLIENGAAYFARIAGLAVDASGALLVADDANGVIYRVSYGTPAAAPDGGAADAPAAPDAGVDGAGTPDAPGTPDAGAEAGTTA